MSEEIKSPTFPESVADGTIANWVKKEGEAVSQDEVIAEIETDKVVLEVLAPSDGKISKIHKNEGDTVLSAELIGEFISGDSEELKTQIVEDEKPKETAPDLESSQDHLEEIKSGPAAKRIIEEKELNPSEIQGSGKDGRITKADVISHVEKDPVIKESVKKTNVDLGRETKRVPMTRLRSTIAKRLVEVQQETAMLTTFNEVDMKPIKDIRSKYGDDFLKEHGVKLGFMGFFVAASVNALEKFPQVNASIDGTDIVYHGYKDIGVAVSTDRGLVVPVIKDADIKSISEIEKSISEYAEKARDGKLSIEEMQGGTFTVSNGGIFGSLLSTPILNAPQTAILGMHKIEDRPVVVDGEIVVRPMMYLAMSYDHRMLDGKEAVSFLVSIKEQLENPEKLLLNL